MNSLYTPVISTVRRFNRFYTNILGLLDQHMLDSEFSLAEARVLYDIGHTKNCTAKQLSEELRIDPGYLSRIIKRFEKNDFIYRVQSQEDGRLYHLHLTGYGKEILQRLNRLSDSQIYQMVGGLPEQDRANIVKSMVTIEKILAKQPALPGEELKIRCNLQPGDVGYLIYLHGWIYADECGYNHEFEGYVCKTFYNFLERYGSEKDKVWLAESHGRIIGAIAIVGHSEIRAQLRWFIIHPAFRGIGLGRTLLDMAMKYCQEKGYTQVFLETTEDQETARAMYEKAGFKQVSADQRKMWGKVLIELTYELDGDIPLQDFV